SEVFSPGARRELAMLGGIGGGLTICYDIRFPELYRALTAEGARILAVPSAFADATGRDHWETLVRARAIENAAFVIAPNQARGETGPLVCHGHSMIVGPWGEILAEAGGADETVIVADLDFGLQDDVRARLPSLAHRRPDVYREA
ncbi:MAG: carbon-nitrogen hydrolase family protein, partial [Actinobacteria bacterium ATB1]|nr:carbon-nitrogen hydrolase family protein [Actinobacteria bacterium ATB1]